MASLRGDADRICAYFGLAYRSLEPERASVKRRYGICYSDGSIQIRLNHVKTRRPLKYSSLISTLCHELAHLRYFDHSRQFQAFYQEILAWARRQGIYVPGTRATAPPAGTKEVPPSKPRRQIGDLTERDPEQLTLF